MQFIKKILLLGTLTLLSTPHAFAPPPETLQIKVANMHQDLSFLTKEVAQLRLEIETLTRENLALKKQLDHLHLSENELKSIQAKHTTEISGLTNSLDSYKKVMLTQVSEEMEQFSKQTQKAIDYLSQSLPTKSPPPTTESFKFTDDYSKVGIAYTVKSGDTLSLIALKNSSTVRDIQNANRIAEPRELKAGQVIFIPTKK